VRLHGALGRCAVALQFDIEAVAEQRLQLLAARLRERVLAARNGAIERAAGPAGERDQPAGLALEPGQLEMRPFLLRRIQIGARAQPHQAAIARFAAGQEH